MEVEDAKEVAEVDPGEDFERAFSEAVKEFEEAEGSESEEEEGKRVEENEAAEGELEELAESEAEEDEERVTSTDEVPEDIELPQSWGKERAEAWNKVPVEAKKVIKERELELLRLVTRRENELQEMIKPIGGALQHIDKYSKSWALGPNPVTREQGIIRAVELYEHIKNSDKLELAKEFLLASGKTPEDLTEVYDDKNNLVKSLQNEINELKSKVDGQNAEVEKRTREAYSQNVSEAYAKFEGTKNAFGGQKYPNASNPYFARQMGSLVTQLASNAPGRSMQEYLVEAYKLMDGRIDTGTNGANSPKEKISKESLSTGYAKGSARSKKPTTYDSYDDALRATMEEFGMLE